jgi:integrase
VIFDQESLDQYRSWGQSFQILNYFSLAICANIVQVYCMDKRKASGTVEVHDGLYLKRGSENSAWQCYYRLDGNQNRRSTKKKDLAEAKLVALRWYSDSKSRISEGGTAERVTFVELASMYLDQKITEGLYSYHDETMARHILPYFKKFDDVSKITNAHVMDYISHRRSKSKKDVLPQTINRENTVLRQALKYAYRRGLLLQPVQVEALNDRFTKNKRRHFTVSEYIKLCHAAQRRISEVKDIPLRRRTYFQRHLLFDYIKFLANCGIRVDEAKTVTWGSVDFDEGTVTLNRAGKLKSSRKVFVRHTGVLALQRILDRRKLFLAENGGDLSPNEKVLSTMEGVPVKDFKKGFSALLEAAGFEYSDPRDRHVLTSLRHSYATFRLTTRRAKRASMRALSIQMGTSEKMIQKHYGHDMILDYEEELRGGSDYE